MLQFEWDQYKSTKNKKKHKISFGLAKLVFSDPFLVSRYNRTIRGENRYQILGQVANCILFVVYTHRELGNGKEVIRIISARKASAKERATYHAK